MILARTFAVTLAIVLVCAVGSLPGAMTSDSHFVSTARAQSDVQRLLDESKQKLQLDQSKLHALIDKLRGANMPEGVVKANGRIEATQVDISAKYPGRLESVTVEEGDTVSAG